MEYKIVYSTYKETAAAKRNQIIKILITGVFCGIGLLLLRDVLAGEILPDREVLERMAQMVEESDGAVAEVIAAFYRGMIVNEST